MVPSARRTGRGRTRGLAPPGRPDAHPRRRGEARPRRRYSAKRDGPHPADAGSVPGRTGGAVASADDPGTSERARAKCGAVRPLADAPMRKGPEREADTADANLVIGERRGRKRNGPFRAERTVGAESRARSGGAQDVHGSESVQEGKGSGDCHAREIGGLQKQKTAFRRLSKVAGSGRIELPSSDRQSEVLTDER